MTDLAAGLLAFVDASPTPYHAVREATRRLVDAGATTVDPAADRPAEGFTVMSVDGALVAWDDTGHAPTDGFRIIGAHTDSPNLRIKPRPDVTAAGLDQLAIEPYGGLLRNSWLDRELGLAGRVIARSPRAPGGVATHLFRDDRAVLRVPQLAIHLDRTQNEGLQLDPARHLTPVWGLHDPERSFLRYVADAAGVLPQDVMCHDTVPACFLGPDEDLISAPRLDDQASCYGAVAALIRAIAADADAASGPRTPHVPLVVLFDHEEVGSESASGAAGPLLRTAIERSVAARGGTSTDVSIAFAASMCCSADMAHGVHPNHAERHDPNHPVLLGGGPVIKTNVNQRYATSDRTAAAFRLACDAAGVPVQVYAHRNDLPCGSTIGPITAARLGIPTVDVGMAQLAMHSIRELMATSDVDAMVAAFTAWLAG
jgi:aspartyl aminopeptidase